MLTAAIQQCEREIAWCRHHIDTGELTPYVDPTQENAAVRDLEGPLCALAGWQEELELLREREAL